MRNILMCVIVCLFGVLNLSAQSFKITFSDHNAAQDLVDTAAWAFVAKNMDRYHAGWTFSTRNIINDAQRKAILKQIGDKPIDIEFDPEEDFKKLKLYMDNIENNGGVIDIITYYMEPQYVPEDEDKSRRGGATLVTPKQMVEIQSKIKKTGRNPKNYKYRGIIRLFSLTDSISRNWIKQYGNLTYEVGIPLRNPNQFNDIINAVEWCYKNDVNIFLMMVPLHKAESSPHGAVVPNPNYLEAYQGIVKQFSQEKILQNQRLNFVLAGYNYKYKKVPIIPEGTGLKYPNTIAGAARWLIDYRESLEN